jgi:hypothetical protein
MGTIMVMIVSKQELNFSSFTILIMNYMLVFYTLSGCLMVLNTTFNNISAISWRSVLMVEETEVPGEIHQPVASH